jgi:fatty acid desaturase
MSGIFRAKDGALPNLLVIFYTIIGWPIGILLLLQPHWFWNVLGVLLTAHTLVYSAYLIHDCAHHAIFKSAAANDRLGVLMTWINGACLANYAGLKKKHLRHHADRLDVVTFDYRAALRRSPAWLRHAVLALEWCYIPAVELVMRALVIGAPFAAAAPAGAGGPTGAAVRAGLAVPESSDALRAVRAARARVIAYAAVRITGFAILGLISLKALMLYALAYLLFLNVLRFMDAFQHTYDVFVSRTLAAAPADPRRDLAYEYHNTYSNLLAEHPWWLNLLVLNFSYHNAHHVRPSEPWYRLPALHRSLYGEARDRQVIPCRELFASFHRFRVQRVLADDYGVVAADGERAAAFMGAVGVSFLTAV